MGISQDYGGLLSFYRLSQRTNGGREGGGLMRSFLNVRTELQSPHFYGIVNTLYTYSVKALGIVTLYRMVSFTPNYE